MGKYLDLIAASRSCELSEVSVPSKAAASCEISEVSPGQVLNSLNSQVQPALRDGFRAALRALDARCPDRVENYKRWRQAVADGGTFLATWGDRAHALGWTVRDLFGLHPVPQKPTPNYQRLSRYDESGLIWLLRGRRVVALAGSTADIENPTGAITIYRKNNKPALDGDPYVEVHHVTPVSKKQVGSLSASNMLTLCANHHRQVHFGHVEIAVHEEHFDFLIDGAHVTIVRPAFAAGSSAHIEKAVTE
jgi:HNH endonuclease